MCVGGGGGGGGSVPRCMDIFVRSWYIEWKYLISCSHYFVNLFFWRGMLKRQYFDL